MDALDPTIPAPMTNVAEYGFEGRLEAWAENERYFDYSKAANPIGSRPDFQDPIKAFGGELYAVAAPGCYTLLGQPAGHLGRHSQSDPRRLGGGWRVRHATWAVASAFQRVGRLGAPHSGAGCGATDLSAKPGHTILRPPMIGECRARQQPVEATSASRSCLERMQGSIRVGAAASPYEEFQSVGTSMGVSRGDKRYVKGHRGISKMGTVNREKAPCASK